MYGKMIKFMRLQRKLKQKDLANKLGIASSTLAHYETEYRAVTLETANKIAKSCNFEICFIDKETNKSYNFKDMKQLTYDVRVKTKDQK